MVGKTSFFRVELLNWFEVNARQLPWKFTKDPYVIWLSEIILQQTRVAQGTPYFLKFLKAFPSIEKFAKADQDTIMNLWEGLGYYSRARNMHATAKYVYHELNGVFPNQYKALLKLKGIGPYTAAAISSFAYDQVYPVVDGNVIRVLSRFFGVLDFVDDSITKKYIQSLAEKCIDKNRPADYNQAIMDFGSLVCIPKSPICTDCPLNNGCQAYQYDNVNIIPRKGKRIKIRSRFFHFLIISNDDTIILQKRREKDIWLGLYQYPLIEKTSVEELEKEEINNMLNSMGLGSYTNIRIDNNVQKQKLTHQKINAVFYHIRVNECIIQKSSPYYLVNIKNLKNFAFPKIIKTYKYFLHSDIKI